MEQDLRDIFRDPSSDQALQDSAILLQGLADGDEAALCLLHRQYAGQLLTLAMRQGLSNPEQAVEDAFMLMYRSAGCFTRCALEPSIWIIGMAFWHFRRMRSDSVGSP
ncbi:hypothetical protein [Deinococcus humi]|uniref:RNA polymerase sigma-70 region 2 domain-containing protein n=1 Tax=Deinococcus humi TaxID=662880 RepID=A0A7W8NJG4_9DEIO|nr:hypothetical protein [Deinococcus humi]MBB5366107.1 hypothetical protein [Deinococcus humi]GGO40163.1 hypothetical protein GCM10008949_49330 [Deinococcus humi]